LIAIYVTETSQSTSAPSLYTAFAQLRSGYASKVIETPYWATTQAKFYNQEIILP
jgi:hypothetical protein